MKVYRRQFNVYLALATALVLCGGCQTEKDPKDKVIAALRIHIEMKADATGSSQTISLLRTDPVIVSIAREIILTEANIINAKIIEVPGGFAVQVRFDENGSWVLEQYSSTNPGKHFVIFGQWGEKLKDGRWLAAPLITHRLGNGVLSFTPDASHDEAEQLVLGLNNVARKTAHDSLQKFQK